MKRSKSAKAKSEKAKSVKTAKAKAAKKKPARKAAAKTRRKAAPAPKGPPVADVARMFAEACKSGAFDQAEALWSADVVSYEAQDGPMREVRGWDAVHAKGAWWYQNHDIHEFKTEGPFVNGDYFTLRFIVDATQKATGQRFRMDEVGLYRVKNGKVVEERFFY